MNEVMAEKIARAMAAAIIKQPRASVVFDETPTLMIADEDSNSFWELLPVARAVIEAMREPSPDMIEAGAFASLDGDDIVGRERAKLCWLAMINEAHNHCP